MHACFSFLCEFLFEGVIFFMNNNDLLIFTQRKNPVVTRASL